MTPSEELSTADREDDWGPLLAWSLVIGVAGGVLAWAYHDVLDGGLSLVWDAWVPALERFGIPLFAMTMLGGGVVGCCVRWLGAPGEIEAMVDNIHLERGRFDLRQTPSMIATSLASMWAGGSAGPEAPLVQIIGSLSGWLGDRIGAPPRRVRTYTFCGMAAALGAFFGAPLGGALFALEIPHRRGLEYYEALIPAVVSSSAAFAVFGAGVGFMNPLYRFAEVPTLSSTVVLQAVLLGALGCGVAMLFQVLFGLSGRLSRRWARRPVLLGAVGGLLLGLLAWSLPAGTPTTTLFWGELQIRDLVDQVQASTGPTGSALVSLLVLLAVVKMLAICVTLRSGFRGGFIFPLFFVGASLGLAVTVATHGWIAPAVACLSLMAAVNVGITKTPLSTTIILATLSGASLVPMLAIASLTSWILSGRWTLIRTQRPRARFEVEAAAVPTS